MPLPPAPEKVDWKETAGLKLTEEQLEETGLFEHFADLADLKPAKPIMIYFYWPEEDAESEDKAAAERARRCKLMDEILRAKEVRSASTLFHCFRCDAKKLSDQLKKHYRITRIPKLVFFDINGRKVWWLTNTKAKPVGIANKMAEIAAASKKLLEKKKADAEESPKADK